MAKFDADFFPSDDDAPVYRCGDPIDGETDFQRDLDAAEDFGGDFDTDEGNEGLW